LRAKYAPLPEYKIDNAHYHGCQYAPILMVRNSGALSLWELDRWLKAAGQFGAALPFGTWLDRLIAQKKCNKTRVLTASALRNGQTVS
jgi:hypothetical protein